MSEMYGSLVLRSFKVVDPISAIIFQLIVMWVCGCLHSSVHTHWTSLQQECVHGYRLTPVCSHPRISSMGGTFQYTFLSNRNQLTLLLILDLWEWSYTFFNEIEFLVVRWVYKLRVCLRFESMSLKWSVFLRVCNCVSLRVCNCGM